jgi:hypothetical protein
MYLQRSGQSAAMMLAVRTPIEPAKRRLLYLERIHQRNDVSGDCRGLTIAMISGRSMPSMTFTGTMSALIAGHLACKAKHR